MTVEAAARGRLTALAYEYYVGGANDEVTVRENRLAFERLAHVRRVDDLDDLLFKRYERARDLLKMIGAAFFEFLGYRQVLAVQRTASFLNVLFRRGQWGKAKRTQIPHSEAEAV